MTTRHARGLLAALAALAVAAPSAALAAGSKRLLGYYPSWARSTYSAATIPYAKLTHIAHAFLLLDPAGDGALKVNPGLLEPDLIARAHAAGVKVLISVGGASAEQEAAFARVAADDARRRLFARNLREFVEANGYDGVDIDWEVPKAPADSESCVLLMRAVRDELPSPRWLVTMAIPADPRGYGSGFDVPALAPLLDFINVMTYDMHGPWSKHAGHNSPLAQSPGDPGREGSIEASIDLYTNVYRVPPRKLNVGTAFYGYEFGGAARLWDPCDCATTTTSRKYGSYIKPRIGRSGWKARTDRKAKAPYLVREDAPGLITYDDAKSTKRKVDYALGTRGLGGVFMWSLDGDYDGQGQDLLDAMFRAFSRHNR